MNDPTKREELWVSLMREKNGTGLRKKKEKEEETKELCDWAVGFKMRRERENGTGLRKKRKKRKRSYATVSWVSE